MSDKKFRRIFVVAQSEVPTDWRELLAGYAEEVTLLALNNLVAQDYLHSMPADCLISDSVVNDEDIYGVGTLATLAEQRALPRLVFYDSRPGFSDIGRLKSRGATCIRFDPEHALQEIEQFLQNAPAFDPDARWILPWQMRPWTISIGELTDMGFRPPSGFVSK